MKYTIIVIVMGYWGRGKTLHEAAQNCKNKGAKRTDKANVLLIQGDDTAEVNNYGYVLRDAGSENHLIGEQIPLGHLIGKATKKSVTTS
jgi:hypothetical protein